MSSFRFMFRKMEKLMIKEMKCFWDEKILSEYLSLERVPRGLGIKKFPTNKMTDESLKKRWRDTLFSCSLELMRIIVVSKLEGINKVQQEILDIEKEILPSKDIV